MHFLWEKLKALVKSFDILLLFFDFFLDLVSSVLYTVLVLFVVEIVAVYSIILQRN